MNRAPEIDTHAADAAHAFAARDAAHFREVKSAHGGIVGLIERIERVARRHREVTGCGYEEAATVALELIVSES